jgi:hypothetical protein
MTSTGNFGGEENSGFPAAFFVGLVIVAIIVGIFVIATHSDKPAQPVQQPKLTFTAEAQSYAASIHFDNLDLSESDNMLGEKFTYLNGVISNNGARTIKAMQVLIEFHDPFNQVILRETHRVISAPAAPLGPKQQRQFSVTFFEHLPAEWNQQYPTIRITGLVLQ